MGVQILLQKVFERGFIQVMAYAENPNFTTYSMDYRSKFIEISDHVSKLKFYHIENSILPRFFGSKSVNAS